MTVMSRRGVTPRCRSAWIATRPATTPAAPSKLPPCGTELRCEPMTMCFALGIDAGQGHVEVGGRVAARSSGPSPPPLSRRSRGRAVRPGHRCRATRPARRAHRDEVGRTGPAANSRDAWTAARIRSASGVGDLGLLHVIGCRHVRVPSGVLEYAGTPSVANGPKRTIVVWLDTQWCANRPALQRSSWLS